MTKCLQTIFAQPSITSFNPTSGPTGTLITILGTNFSQTPANNIVFFGATKSTVSSASTTQLTVIAPTGATFQPITVTTNNLTAYSEQPFIVTFPCDGVIDSTFFANKLDYPSGDYSYSVAIGDFDGDGKADVAIANAITSNTISIFRNTSSIGVISFAPKVNFTSEYNPESIAIGDLDGDGKLDFAVTNFWNDTVSVFRNTSTSGTISFAVKLDYTTGVYPADIAIDDLDEDGKPEIIVDTQDDNTISVFRNTSSIGSISFAAKVGFATGIDPADIAIDDLDGDGKAELIVANYGDTTVSILRNTCTTGTISFSAKMDFITGNYPFGLAIGDLNGDGKPDLATSSPYDSDISVLKNMSVSGTLSFDTKVNYSTGSAPYSLSVSDLDGDGKLDVAVANYNSNTVSVLKNVSTSGAISLSPKVDFVTGTNPMSISNGDLDGDSKPEIVVANFNDTSVSVLMSQHCLTGIEQLKMKNEELIVYPNPATNTLTITNITHKTTIRLFDIFGKLVIETETEDSVTLDASQLSQGIYTIITESNNEKTFNKVVIVKL